MIKEIWKWIYNIDPNRIEEILIISGILAWIATWVGGGILLALYLHWAIGLSWAAMTFGVPVILRAIDASADGGIKGWWDERPWKN